VDFSFLMLSVGENHNVAPLWVSKVITCLQLTCHISVRLAPLIQKESSELRQRRCEFKARMTLKAIVLPNSLARSFHALVGIVIRHFFGTGDIYVNQKQGGAGELI